MHTESQRRIELALRYHNIAKVVPLLTRLGKIKSLACLTLVFLFTFKDTSDAHPSPGEVSGHERTTTGCTHSHKPICEYMYVKDRFVSRKKKACRTVRC